MTLSARQLLQRGFTLVELLIVVIILAILAAIVIPQFNSATSDTQEAALDTNLATMRNAIELYKAQHGTYPAATAATGGSACPSGGTKSTGAINTERAFIDQLTQYTDASGNACSVGDTTFKYGPYIRKGIPSDPINNVATVTVATSGAPLTSTVTTGGWKYDNKSGQIVMNSSANDSQSRAYYTH